MSVAQELIVGEFKRVLDERFRLSIPSELADRLTAEYPDLKVLFLSGYPGDSQLGHGVLDPGLALLQKPFSPVQLSQKVRERLDGPTKRPTSKLVG